jgi:CBS domain containing-hemolysin-like protein
VTLEDVLEQLVGEVGDEFEKDAQPRSERRHPASTLDGLVGSRSCASRLHFS